MLGRVFIGIVSFFLLIGVFSSSITTGIHNWRSNDTTQSFVVTTGGVTTANVTLSHDLYQSNVAEVAAITSSISETPVASSYASRALVLAALTPSQTRTLTIEYYAETDDSIMRIIGPFLAILIFGGCAGAILYGIFHKGR